MSFWGDPKWLAAQQAAPIISGFLPTRLEDGCYRLSLGDEAIISSSDPHSAGTYQKISACNPVTLKPGQFAYLITGEVVKLPANAIGFINVATSIKIKGLVNISGFHVDPQYEGKLIFTVFNAGPSNITLSFGEATFRMWLSDFDPPSPPSKPGTSYDKIPQDWIDRLHGVYPSPFALADQVNQLERDVKRIDGQKKLIAAALFVATVFLGPFVAALYAETLGPYFHEPFKRWMENHQPTERVGADRNSADGNSVGTSKLAPQGAPKIGSPH